MFHTFSMFWFTFNRLTSENIIPKLWWQPKMKFRLDRLACSSFTWWSLCALRPSSTGFFRQSLWLEFWRSFRRRRCCCCCCLCFFSVFHFIFLLEKNFGRQSWCFHLSRMLFHWNLVFRWLDNLTTFVETVVVNKL